MGTFPQTPTYPIDLRVQPGSGLRATRRGPTIELSLDPDGLPGGGGSGSSVGQAAQIVSGQRVLIATDTGLAHASNLDPLHFGRVVGISLNAALVGADVSYASDGPIDDPAWTWGIGPVFLSEDGRLTQEFRDSAPAAFVQQVAQAITSTRLVVGLGPPIGIAA